VSKFWYTDVFIEEEEDRDDDDAVIECQLSETKNPKGMELLQAAHLNVWYEFPSNHMELFQAA